MSFEVDRELIKLIEEVLERSIIGAKSEIETKKYKVKCYQVNSSIKYANSSLRIDIQDLELRSY